MVIQRLKFLALTQKCYNDIGLDNIGAEENLLYSQEANLACKAVHCGVVEFGNTLLFHPIKARGEILRFSTGWTRNYGLRQHRGKGPFKVLLNERRSWIENAIRATSITILMDGVR